MPRKLIRRKLNKTATLRAYELRMRSLPLEALKELENKFISSYDLYDTFNKDEIAEQIELRRDKDIDNSAFRLAHVCRERGVELVGVTSERIRNGKPLAALGLPNRNRLDDVVYVGQTNSFCKKQPHKTLSLLPRDKRY